MSSISDLKNENIDIDMTNDIDGTESKTSRNEQVHYTNKTVPSMMKKKEETDTVAVKEQGGRRVVSISDIAQPAEKENRDPDDDVTDPANALAKKILEGEDSMFNEYLTEKKAEYAERMKQFDEERMELIREGKLKPEDIEDQDWVEEHLGGTKDTEENGQTYKDEDIDLDDELGLEDDDETDNTGDNSADTDSSSDSAEGLDDEDGIDIDLDDEPEEEIDFVQPKEKKVVEMEVKKTEKNKEKESEEVDGEGIDIEVTTMSTFEKKEEETNEEESVEEDVEDDDTIKRLKELATEKLKPAFKKLDISNFQIVTKKATSNISNLVEDNQIPVVKWVLPIQNQVVFMKQFSGLELQTLSDDIQEDSLSSTRHAYRMIYDHIMSAGKPKTFNAWLKCTPEEDLEHYFFAVFVGSYKGTNFLPMTCPNTKCADRTFITDDIPIMKLVKFTNDEQKKKFSEIYKSEIVYENADANYVVSRVPITNDIAIDFKESTLFDQLTKQNIASDAAFVEKYGTMFGNIQYIDTIYKIDWENGSLIPISYDSSKTAGNEVQQYKAKIKKYSQVLDTLTSDQFSVIRSIVANLSNRTEGFEPMMHYVTPEVTCPNCGTVIEEETTNAVQLVFTRYQLGALVNTTLK